MALDSEPTPSNSSGTDIGRGEGGRAKLAGRSLTAVIIKGMAPGDELADPEHPGLRVRCVSLKAKDATGKPAVQAVFFYRYRSSEGALRQVTIGVLGPKTLASIRKEWEELRARVRNGDDPRQAEIAEKQKAVTARRQAATRALTVEDVVEQYLSEKVDQRRKAKGAGEARRLLNQVIRFNSWLASPRATGKVAGRRRPKLPNGIGDVAHLPADQFTRVMAHELLRAFGENAPRSGGMARQELRACWRYGIAVGRLNGPSPFEKLQGGQDDDLGGGGLVAASRRDRVLSRDEVGLLLRWMSDPAPGKYSKTVSDALEVVLRTGLRSGEVCSIHSSWLTARDGVWWLDVPAEHMKGRRGKQAPHSVPLVGRAAELLLARMPSVPGYLFPSADRSRAIQQKVLGVEVYACSGRSSATAYKHRAVCPVTGWAPHDLRRTARTLLAELGCPYEVGESILAHTLPGVAAVYNRARYVPQKVEWLIKLGELLDALARGTHPT